jgi:tRNA A37 threonylcarbamoyladenosine modification protein TsaB
VIDARKNSVYTAAYKQGERIRDPLDLKLRDLANYLAGFPNVLLTGPGIEIAKAVCKDLPGLHFDRRFFAWNRGYVELGISRLESTGADKPDAGPVYLRKSDAELMRDR